MGTTGVGAEDAGYPPLHDTVCLQKPHAEINHTTGCVVVPCRWRGRVATRSVHLAQRIPAAVVEIV